MKKLLQHLHVRQFESDLEREFLSTAGHMLPKAKCASFVALACLSSFIPRMANTRLWLFSSSVVTNMLYIMVVCITASTFVFTMWVARQPEKRIQLYEHRVTKMIAAGFIVYPLTDQWRMPRMLNQDMFHIYGTNYIDDSLLIFGMMFVVLATFSFPLRSSQSWIIPAAGSITFSVTTLLFGGPENDPSMRNRYFRDLINVILLNCIFFVTWFGSMERERYMRWQFLYIRETKQRLAVTEASLKGYVDSWAILREDCILESSPIIDELLGFKAEGRRMGDLLAEGDQPRLERFLAEIQNCKSCQKINVSFKATAGETWEVEVFGVYIADGHTHLAIKQQQEQRRHQQQQQTMDVNETDNFWSNEGTTREDQRFHQVGEHNYNLAGAGDVQSEIASTGSTTTGVSAQVFKPFMSCEAAHMESSFGQLIKLGCKEHWLLEERLVKLPNPMEMGGA